MAGLMHTGFWGKMMERMGMFTVAGWDGKSIFVAVVCLFVTICFTISVKRRPKLRLPPGPIGLPILGSLLQLGALPHRSLEAMAQKYGPVMFLKLGTTKVIVISSVAMTREVIKNNDNNFLDRPPTALGRYMGMDYNDVLFSSGTQWRLARRVLVTHLLSNTALKKSKNRKAQSSMRTEEVTNLVGTILASANRPLQIRPLLHTLMTALTSRSIFGTRCVDDPKSSTRTNQTTNTTILGDDGHQPHRPDQFTELVEDFFAATHKLSQTAAKPNISDFIPALASLDPQGLSSELKECGERMASCLGHILADRRRERQQGGGDDGEMTTATTDENFVDVLLDIQCKEGLPEKALMGILVDALTGAYESTYTTLEWILCEVVRHPKMAMKIRDEITRAIGGPEHRLVEESDLPALPYLQAFMEEVMRLHPPTGLPPPHYGPHATTIAGYDIPPKSLLLTNLWAVHHDQSFFDQPLKFNPDRTTGNSSSLISQTSSIFPFGYGKRICPGMTMAIGTLQYTIAVLVQLFEWRPPPGMKCEEVDNIEGNGAFLPLATPLIVVATPCLPIPFYDVILSQNKNVTLV